MVSGKDDRKALDTLAMAEAFENYYYEWYLKRVPPFMLLFGGVLCILSALYMVFAMDFEAGSDAAMYLALIDGLVGLLLLLVYLYLRSLVAEYARIGRRTAADYLASGLIVIYSIIIGTAPHMPASEVIFVFGVMSLLLVPRLKPWRLLLTALLCSIVFISVNYFLTGDAAQIMNAAINAAAAVTLAYVLSVISYTNRAEAFAWNYRLDKANALLKAESELDPLTGLVNRRRSNAVFAMEWARAKRSKEWMSILMVDIDDLKGINDRLGHAMGDECILTVANAMKSVVKRGSDFITRCSDDLASRYGGDEFMLLLPGTDKQGASKVAELIISRVRERSKELGMGDKTGKLTVSIGLASSQPTGDEEMKGLFDRADKALYAAKLDGRDKYVIGD